MLYKNSKAIVRSSNGDIDFDIVAGVLLGDALPLFLFRIYQDYIFRTSIYQIKENGFTLKKERNRKCPVETITGPGNTDDLGHLANTPTQIKSLRFSQEQARRSVGHHVAQIKQSSCLSKKKPFPL